MRQAGLRQAGATGNTVRLVVLYINYWYCSSNAIESKAHTHENIHLNEAFRSWSGSPWTVGPGMMTGGPVQLRHNPVSPLSL